MQRIQIHDLPHHQEITKEEMTLLCGSGAQIAKIDGEIMKMDSRDYSLTGWDGVFLDGKRGNITVEEAE